MDLFVQILVIILLILLNGFFVASEFVLIALRRTRIEEMVTSGNPLARFIKDAVDHLDNFISATQLGVTIVSLLLGWLGESVISGKIIGLLNFLPGGPLYFFAHSLALIVVFFLITYFQIVLGELVPKTIALERAELVATIVILPLTLFARIFHPFILILNKSASMALKLMGMKTAISSKMPYTEEEVKMILHDYGHNGNSSLSEGKMVENVFKLRDISIRQIIIPRMDIMAFEETTTLQMLVKKIENKGYSRYPVYHRTIDDIIGFVHVKDIYRADLKVTGDKKLIQTDLIRNVLTVPENKKADEVLLDMRKKNIHMAVVDDEYGGTTGIVTLEDIIESLVGEIQDEFDKPIKEIKRQVDGSFIIDGRASLETVQKRFPMQIKGLGYSTIGGMVFGLLGREPKVGNKVQLGNIIFEVAAIDGKRVKTVKLIRAT